MVAECKRGPPPSPHLPSFSQVTLGGMGYSVFLGSPSSVSFASAASIAVGNFTLYVVDAGGNPLGTSDRYFYSATSNYITPVTRYFTLTCPGLTLGGSASFDTGAAGQGTATIYGLTLLAPPLGTYYITATETRVAYGLSVYPATLVAGTLRITIIAGSPARLYLYNSPMLVYSPSFGAETVYDSAKYDAASLTPLNAIAIASGDAGSNLLTNVPAYYSSATTVLTTTAVCGSGVDCTVASNGVFFGCSCPVTFAVSAAVAASSSCYLVVASTCVPAVAGQSQTVQVSAVPVGSATVTASISTQKCDRGGGGAGALPRYLRKTGSSVGGP